MNWKYEKGLHDLGNGAYAWLAPDGGWGWSNAGLIVDSGESLLIDTLFDLPLTREMLKAMRSAEPDAAKTISTLVNTHANGDHCHGNQLVEGAEIIASIASAQEMAELPAESMAALMHVAKTMGPVGDYFIQCFGAFQFDGITHTPPTKTFEGRLDVTVGNKKVELIQVGPAHTRGDILAHIPEDRTVFTGDILFIQGTPIMWAGPVENWIKACRLIEAMEVETIVPGHGPITDKQGVCEVRRYLEYIRDETRKRYDAGMDAFDAAKDIELGEYSGWRDAERIAVNVDRLYRDFAGDQSIADVTVLFGRMAELAGIAQRE